MKRDIPRPLGRGHTWDKSLIVLIWGQLWQCWMQTQRRCERCEYMKYYKTAWILILTNSQLHSPLLPPRARTLWEVLQHFLLLYHVHGMINWQAVYVALNRASLNGHKLQFRWSNNVNFTESLREAFQIMCSKLSINHRNYVLRSSEL